MRKIIVNFDQDNWYPGRVLNPGSKKYEAGMLTTRKQRSLFSTHERISIIIDVFTFSGLTIQETYAQRTKEVTLIDIRLHNVGGIKYQQDGKLNDFRKA